MRGFLIHQYIRKKGQWLEEKQRQAKSERERGSNEIRGNRIFFSYPLMPQGLVKHVGSPLDFIKVKEIE